MINEETSLLEKRAELKRVINEGMEKTFPAYFFNAVGRRLVRILHLNKIPYWTINATVLGVLAFLPGILVSVVTREIYHWEKAHLLFFSMVVFAYLAPIISHMNVIYNVLPGIRDGLVNAIESVEDLKKLQSWLSTFWFFQKWLLFMTSAGIIFGTVMTVGSSLSLGVTCCGKCDQVK